MQKIEDSDVDLAGRNAEERERFEKEISGELPPTSIITYWWDSLKQTNPEKFTKPPYRSPEGQLTP